MKNKFTYLSLFSNFAAKIQANQIACSGSPQTNLANMTQPKLCRPEAFEYFAEQLPRIESTEGLLNATLAISMHAFDDVHPEDVDLRLMALASRVRARFRGNQVQAMMAHLHHVLFEEEGFLGNQRHFYSPLNSYLPAVLESRRGVPATLGLIYKVVGEQVGLHVEGVNAPGHFMVRVRGQRDWLLIDPYFCGAVLTREEAFRRIEQVIGRKISRKPKYLRPASNREWLQRILANLQHIFRAQSRTEDLTAMIELQSLLSE